MRSSMEFAQTIRRMRNDAGLNQLEFAQEVGVSQATVSRWESGKQDPELEQVRQLQRFATEKGLRPIAVMARESRNSVGVYGYVGAGAEVSPFNDSQEQPFEFVEIDFPVRDGTAALVVRGDSQIPVFEDGDLVGYHKDGKPPSDTIGKVCIIRLADGRMFIKKIRKGSIPGYFTLTSSNASDIEDVIIEWSAPYTFKIPRDEWRKY